MCSLNWVISNFIYHQHPCNVHLPKIQIIRIKRKKENNQNFVRLDKRASLIKIDRESIVPENPSNSTKLAQVSMSLNRNSLSKILKRQQFLISVSNIYVIIVWIKMAFLPEYIGHCCKRSDLNHHNLLCSRNRYRAQHQSQKRRWYKFQWAMKKKEDFHSPLFVPQCNSSEPSAQSISPSHLNDLWMHVLSLHWNSSLLHAVKLDLINM